MAKTTKAGRPKRKPGPKVEPDGQKTERLTFRVHPDLLQLLDARAAEAGINRSQYVEKILIGWLRADPRNPKIDLRSGKIDRDAMSPQERRLKFAMSYASQQAKFNAAYEILLGTGAPARFFESPDEYCPLL